MSYRAINNAGITPLEAQALDRQGGPEFSSDHHKAKVGLGSKLHATLPTETEKQNLPNIPSAAEVARIPSVALPSPSGNNDKYLKVDSGGTAYEAATVFPPSLAKLPNTNSPVALFDFNGDLVDDGSASEDFTVAAGTANYVVVPGTNDRSFWFDGSTYLSCAANAAHRITGDMTINMVFELDSYAALHVLARHVGTAGSELAPDNILYAVYLVNGVPQYAAETGAGTNIDYSLTGYRLPLHTKLYLAMVRSANEIQFYLNGQALGPASSGLSAPSGGGSGNLLFGASGNEFEGTLHSLEIEDSALDAATILATAQTLGLAA